MSFLFELQINFWSLLWLKHLVSILVIQTPHVVTFQIRVVVTTDSISYKS